jgi:hypothetical protein
MTRDLLDSVVIHPGRRLSAELAATLTTSGPGGTETTPVAKLELALDGAMGERHAGFTRRAGPREPWYRRGTEIRSGRQLSVVSTEELWEIGHAMGLPAIEAGWIGANLVISGVPRLSFLPPGTRMIFEGGATIVVEGQNAPCRIAGRAIARHTERPGDERSFPKVAKRLRGLVATVERAGPASPGPVAIALPEQWIY